MSIGKIFPGFVVALTALYFIVAMVPARDAADGFQYQKFGRLPIVDRGRIKPMDTFARTSLLLLSERQDFKEFSKWGNYQAGETKTQPALKWLLDLMAYSDPIEVLAKDDKIPAAYSHRVLRIENDQVLDLLKLEPRPGFYRYSLLEIRPQYVPLAEEAERIRDVNGEPNLFASKILHLEQRIGIINSIGSGSAPLVIPPRGGVGKDWRSLREGVAGALQKKDVSNPALRSWIVMLLAYRDGKVDDFNKALDEYAKSPEASAGNDFRIELEVFMNNFNPFVPCAVVYGLMFVLACLSWLVWPNVLNRTVFWTLVLTVVVHTLALLARMVIHNRPPITNLYSTAIFIGWFVIVVALILECYFKNGLALAIGSLIGLCSLIIAYYWSLEGDTLEMMQAVLDTNFWLWTHVTSVNCGYGATILAGFMGVAYILLGLFTTLLSRGTAAHLGKATYGVVCFAMLLSFVGTVLGGIWADQSWGRFWGWDPKENGALLIVIWNALILHARWAGLVKTRGIAVLAVAGNVITAWSWVGTNQLGVGLHAYAKSTGTLMVMLTFDAIMATVMLLGLIPLRFWASFQTPASKPTSPVDISKSETVGV